MDKEILVINTIGRGKSYLEQYRGNRYLTTLGDIGEFRVFLEYNPEVKNINACYKVNITFDKNFFKETVYIGEELPGSRVNLLEIIKPLEKIDLTSLPWVPYGRNIYFVLTETESKIKILDSDTLKDLYTKKLNYKHIGEPVILPSEAVNIFRKIGLKNVFYWTDGENFVFFTNKYSYVYNIYKDLYTKTKNDYLGYGVGIEKHSFNSYVGFIKTITDGNKITYIIDTEEGSIGFTERDYIIVEDKKMIIKKTLENYLKGIISNFDIENITIKLEVD